VNTTVCVDTVSSGWPDAAWDTRSVALKRRCAASSFLPARFSETETVCDAPALSVTVVLPTTRTLRWVLAQPLFRDAVIAVDILGMSYRKAARSLRTREETVASRLHRGRQHIARELVERGA
jgi:hypothetical protein